MTSGFPGWSAIWCAGLALGPSVAGIVPAGVLEDLAMMKRLAVGLIGLLAGAELRVADLRDRHRVIALVLVFQTAAVLAALLVTTLLLRRWIPFLSGLDSASLFFVALLFAVLLTVNSPMVTLALLTETRASGPLAKITLGVVLVADVLVILLFTGAFSIARASLGGAAAAAPEILLRLLREVLGSILAGAFVGGVVSLYLRFVSGSWSLRGGGGVCRSGGGAGTPLRVAAQPGGGRVSGGKRGAGPSRASGPCATSDGSPGLRHLLCDGRGRASSAGVCRGVAYRAPGRPHPNRCH